MSASDPLSNWERYEIVLVGPGVPLKKQTGYCIACQQRHDRISWLGIQVAFSRQQQADTAFSWHLLLGGLWLDRGCVPGHVLQYIEQQQQWLEALAHWTDSEGVRHVRQRLYIRHKQQRFHRHTGICAAKYQVCSSVLASSCAWSTLADAQRELDQTQQQLAQQKSRTASLEQQVTHWQRTYHQLAQQHQQLEQQYQQLKADHEQLQNSYQQLQEVQDAFQQQQQQQCSEQLAAAQQEAADAAAAAQQLRLRLGTLQEKLGGDFQRERQRSARQCKPSTRYDGSAVDMAADGPSHSSSSSSGGSSKDSGSSDDDGHSSSDERDEKSMRAEFTARLQQELVGGEPAGVGPMADVLVQHLDRFPTGKKFAVWGDILRRQSPALQAKQRKAAASRQKGKQHRPSQQQKAHNDIQPQAAAATAGAAAAAATAAAASAVAAAAAAVASTSADVQAPTRVSSRLQQQQWNGSTAAVSAGRAL